MKRWEALIVIAMLSLATAACTIQMPTEKQTNVDLRPQIAFRVTNPALEAYQLQIFVDDLPMGVVSTYLADEQTLRVLPGTHVVRIVRGGQVLLDERLYIGDGMTKILVVN